MAEENNGVSTTSAPVVIDLAFNVNEKNVLSVISDVIEKANKMSEQGLDISFNTEALEKSLTQLYNGKGFKDIKIGTEGIEQGINDATTQMSKVLTQAYANAQTKLQTAFQAYNKKKPTFADAQEYRDALQEFNSVIKLIQSIDPNKVFETINLDGKKLINIDENGIDEVFKEVTAKIQKIFKEAQKQAEAGIKTVDLKKQADVKKEEIRTAFDEIAKIINEQELKQTTFDGKEFINLDLTDDDIKKEIEQKFQYAFGLMQDYAKIYQKRNNKLFSWETTNEKFSHDNDSGVALFTKGDISQTFKALFPTVELSSKLFNDASTNAETLFNSIKINSVEVMEEIDNLKNSIDDMVDNLSKKKAKINDFSKLTNSKEEKQEVDALCDSLLRLKELAGEDYVNAYLDVYETNVSQIIAAQKKYYKQHKYKITDLGNGSSSGNGSGEGFGTSSSSGSETGNAITDEEVTNAERLAKIDFNPTELNKYLSTLREISPILAEVKKTIDELSTSIKTLSQDLSESSFTNFTNALDAVKKSYDTLASSFKEDSGLEARIGEIKQLFEIGLKNIDFNVEEVAKKISTGTQDSLLENKLTVYVNEIKFAENAIESFVTDAQSKLDAGVQNLSVKVNLIADGNIKADNLMVQLPTDNAQQVQTRVQTEEKKKEIVEETKAVQENITNELKKQEEIVEKTNAVETQNNVAPVEKAKEVLSIEEQTISTENELMALVDKIYAIEENLSDKIDERKVSIKEIFTTYQSLLPLYSKLTELNPAYSFTSSMGEYAGDYTPEAMKRNVSEYVNKLIEESDTYKKIIKIKEEYNKLEAVDGKSLTNDKRIARLERLKELQQSIIFGVEKLSKTEMVSFTGFNTDSLVEFDRSIEDIDFALTKLQERIADLKTGVGGNSDALIKNVEAQIKSWSNKSRTGNLGKKSLDAYEEFYNKIASSQTIEQYTNILPDVGTRLVDEATVAKALKTLEDFRAGYDATGKKIQEVAVKTTQETQAINANTEAKQKNVQTNTEVGNTNNNINSPVVNEENLNTAFEDKEINIPITLTNLQVNEQTLIKLSGSIYDYFNTDPVHISMDVSPEHVFTIREEVQNVFDEAPINLNFHLNNEEANTPKEGTINPPALPPEEITISKIVLTPEVLANLTNELNNAASPVTIGSITYGVDTVTEFVAAVQNALLTSSITIPTIPQIDPTQSANVDKLVNASKTPIDITIKNFDASESIIKALKTQIETQISPIDINKINANSSIATLKDSLKKVFESFDFNIGVKNNLISDKTSKKAHSITNEITDTVSAMELEVEAYNNTSRAAVASANSQIDAIRKVTQAVKDTKSELGKLDITITQIYDNRKVKEAKKVEDASEKVAKEAKCDSNCNVTSTKENETKNKKNNNFAEIGRNEKQLVELIKTANVEEEKFKKKLAEVLQTSNRQLQCNKDRANSLEAVSKAYGNIAAKSKQAQTIIPEDITSLDEAIQKNKEIKDGASKIERQYQLVTKTIGEVDEAIKALQRSSVDKKSEEYNSALTGLMAQKSTLEEKRQAIGETKATSDLSGLNKEVANYVTEAQWAIASSKDLKKEFSNTISIEKLSKNYSALITKMETFAQKNSKFLSDEGLAKKYNDILKQAQSTALYNPQHLIQTQKQFEQLQAEIVSTGNAGYSLKDTLVFLFEKIGGKALIGSAINYVQMGLRQILTTTKEIDSAMTDLKKVSTETQVVYDKFLKSAGQTAIKLGSTMKELISSTTDFARLGYSVNEAVSLAQNAIVYSNVGDLDIETATADLVSATKAFGLATNQVGSIVDKFNEVGNKFAVSSAGLGKGLQNSASALAVAGNSLDESIALITGGAEILQDSGEMGAALKILSLRLRGMSTTLSDMNEETEGVITNTSKLQDKIKGLTAVNGNKGFEIMADADNFKSTYEIMQGIAKVWNDLSDANRASLLEIIAGKNRSNAVSSLLSNWSQVEASLQTSLNSAGSAAKENAKYIDSIEGRIAQLQSTFQNLSTTIVETDIAKDVISMGSGILEFLDSLIVDTDAISENIRNSFEGKSSNVVKDTVLSPIAENLELIGNVLEETPNTIQAIIKQAKLLPPIIGAISAAMTISKKNAGKLIARYFKKKTAISIFNTYHYVLSQLLFLQ